MCSMIEIGGRTIPMYSICGISGALIGLFIIIWRCRKHKLNTEDAVYIYVLSFAGALIGAKLLYLLTVFPAFIHDLKLLAQDPKLFIELYLQGGFVLYGGLLGGLATAYFTSRSYKVSLSTYSPAILPALAVFCGFGRIGCFMAGCCYGVRTTLPIGVVFPAGSIAPSGIPLLPVQLFEAGFDFSLFLLMLWVTDHAFFERYAIRLYLLIYAGGRFVLEFFRGDIIRGIWGGLSTSQWISLAIFLLSGRSLIAERLFIKNKNRFKG